LDEGFGSGGGARGFYLFQGLEGDAALRLRFQRESHIGLDRHEVAAQHGEFGVFVEDRVERGDLRGVCRFQRVRIAGGFGGGTRGVERAADARAGCGGFVGFGLVIAIDEKFVRGGEIGCLQCHVVSFAGSEVSISRPATPESFL
jgi:hypothetical protein